ncbi:MAG: M48 family metallopeptidase [Hydrogenophilaceae bacterium]|nr:M48 family metallopeptidase [Hydrogenophilaceae bacterium]
MPFRRSILREAEQRELRLGDTVVAYTLKRSSARRSLALRVSEAGEVTVNAPLRMAWRHIEAFLAKHSDWLRQRLQAVRDEGSRWHEGMALPYLGQVRVLSLAPDALPCVFPLADRMIVGGSPEAVPQVVTEWYQAEAEPLLRERLALHVERIGQRMPRFRMTGATSRWGSLSPTGVLSLNWRLIKASLAEIDYVICHELAHVRVPNHSRAFWREVAALYPDFEPAKDQLRRNGALYFQF